MIQTIRTFFNFLSRPRRLILSEANRADQFTEIIQLFIFVFAMVVFVAAPIIVMVGGEDLPNKLSELTDLGFDNKFMQFLAMAGLAVVAAPLIEEIIFRFPLKFRRGALAFGAVLIGMLATGVLMTVGLVFDKSAMIGSAIGLLSYIWVLVKYKDGVDLDKLVYDLFPYLFYASAMIFAFVHITNYELPPEKWYITPASVLPQFFLGLMLGYARIKYGLWAAIFLHAMNNLIPTIAMALMPEGGM